MKKLKRILCTVISACMIFMIVPEFDFKVSAIDSDPTHFTYIDNGDGTVSIASYTGGGIEVSIPATSSDSPEGKPVTKINDYAF